MSVIGSYKVKMDVRVINKKDGTILLPTERHECVVQPPPHYTHRQNILDIEIEAMAKIKYMNYMYSRLTNERDISNRLAGREWTIELVALEMSEVRAEPVAA